MSTHATTPDTKSEDFVVIDEADIPSKQKVEENGLNQSLLDDDQAGKAKPPRAVVLRREIIELEDSDEDGGELEEGVDGIQSGDPLADYPDDTEV